MHISKLANHAPNSQCNANTYPNMTHLQARLTTYAHTHIHMARFIPSSPSKNFFLQI